MPVLLVLLFIVAVNFSSFVLADQGTQIRGPRGTDKPAVTTPVQLGPLRASDTLWRIAEQVKPEPQLSTYQVMYAIYQKNPDAFIDDNLNHLRPGAILVLPDAAEIRAVNIRLARDKAQADERNWQQRSTTATGTAGAAQQTTQPVTVQPSATQSVAPPVSTTSPAIPTATTSSEIQTELQQLKTEQAQALGELQKQFRESIELVEVIADENNQLKNTLSVVQRELETLKNQLGEDSELQQQLNSLLKQQQEVMAQQNTIAESSSFNWASLFSGPLGWILAAFTPALVILLGVLLWIKQRGKRTEEVINAAQLDAVADPAYQSPVPPLDETDNQDLDDASLFEIDDSLLDDAFTEEDKLTENPSLLEDEFIQDDTPLAPDDDLIDDGISAETATETVADADGEILQSESEDIDLDDILSDDALDSLLSEPDDAEQVVELADDLPQDEDKASNTAPVILPGTLKPSDELIPDVIEEIDLDIVNEPDSSIDTEPVNSASEALMADITELNDIADGENPDEIVEVLPEDEPLQQQIDAVPEEYEAVTLDEQQTEFEHRTLDEFAESLIQEKETETISTEDNTEQKNAEAMLYAELEELLDQVDPVLATQPIDYEKLLANEEPVDDAENKSAADIIADEQDAIEDDNLQDDSLDGLDEEEDENVDLAVTEELPEEETASSADNSSVERPSRLLETYPDLALTEEFEDDILSVADEDLLSDNNNDDVEAEASPDLPEYELALDELDDKPFDELLSELEDIADEEPELASSEADALADNELSDEITDAEQVLTDDDFVEIDSLLAASEQTDETSGKFDNLNVDVGLDEFADVIGETEKLDVDKQDNGYAAKLDLVRAYMEIADTESADLLLDEILTSDAPEHIKEEAQKLKTV